MGHASAGSTRLRSGRALAVVAGSLAALALALALAGLWWMGALRAGRLPVAEARAEVPETLAPLARVAALGRIEPKGGVRRIAGPPRPAVVIGKLEVEEGDRVHEGQVLAVLAGIGVERADVDRLRAELANAERELARNQELRRGRVVSESELEGLALARDVARARLARAEAELELSRVRSPIDGQVLEIHAREGERVGPDGIAELGQTSAMYAVAEVYETDIGRVHVGQRARMRSPALPHELTGVVERVGLKVGRKDVLSTDPVADADARVVEVRIRIDEPELAAALTNLRVDVVIEP